MEIKIVYTAVIDEDYLTQQKEFGHTIADMKKDILKHGIQSDYLLDYEVEELPDFEAHTNV